MKSNIEQAMGNKAAAHDRGADGEAEFQQLAEALTELMAETALPANFDIERACEDTAFAKLLLELPPMAAVRVYAAEQRAGQAEENAKNNAAETLRRRSGLPRIERAGGAVRAEPDYMSMSSEEFRKLEQQLKRASRAGRQVRI